MLAIIDFLAVFAEKSYIIQGFMVKRRAAGL
jgi:hypothetical protein